jgi:TetR/AcrR family transcriptional regulator
MKQVEKPSKRLAVQEPKTSRGKSSKRSVRTPLKAKRVMPSPVVAAWGDRVPTRQTQRELKEEILYETAARCFNKNGYHGTSLTDLANELGIKKTSIYNYVADKRELLYGIHVRSLEAARAAKDEAATEKTGLAKIRKMVFNYVSEITHSPTITFILLEDGALAPEQADEVLAGRTALDHELRIWVAEGIKDKSIVPCDPKMVSLLITGGLAWVSKWYNPGGEWSGEQLAESMSIYFARMLSTSFVDQLPAPRPAMAR